MSTDRLKHTILPPSDLRPGGGHSVLQQGQRRRTVLQPHEILHGQHPLSHLYAGNGSSACLYVLNIHTDILQWFYY